MLISRIALIFVVMITLSHCEIITTTSETLSASQSTASSYRLKTSAELTSLKRDFDFIRMVALIKEFWKRSMSEILGDVTAVEDQILNGINRRFTFEVKNGLSVKKVLITVFTQPWSSVMKVVATSPLIPGGIAESDLTKIVIVSETVNQSPAVVASTATSSATTTTQAATTGSVLSSATVPTSTATTTTARPVPTTITTSSSLSALVASRPATTTLNVQNTVDRI